MKGFLTVAAVVTVALLVVSTACAQEFAEVTVTGESAHSFEGAKEDALRRAVEAGAGKTVFSDTRVANFQLMHDTIVSRAAGYVKSFDVLSRDEANGVYTVRVRATVAVGSIDEDWGALAVLIERKGNPTLLVVVEETLDGRARSDRTSEYKLRDIFDGLGFDIVDDEALAGIGQRGALRASLVGDERKAASIAAQLHATYAVTGRANVRTYGASNVRGVSLVPAVADLNLKIVAADNAYLVASKSSSSRRTAREAGTAVRTALEDAAAAVAAEAIPRMLEHWARDLDVGGIVTLTGTRIETAVLNALVERLRGADGVKAVNVVDHNRELTTVKVVSRLEAMSLAGSVETLSGGRLAVTGYSPGAVKFAMAAEERVIEKVEDSVRPGRIVPSDAPPPAGGDTAAGGGRFAVSWPVLVLGAAVVLLVALVIGLLASRRR